MSPIALVTGAGSGIGRATAVALANTGFTVALAGRQREPLEAAAAEAGHDAIAIGADVRDPASVAALFAEIEKRFDRLDLLFNNAGVSAKAVPMEELELEDWRSVIETNLTGAFLCTQHAFRIMKEQTPRGGRIINNGSISAHNPRPNSAPYTSTADSVKPLSRNPDSCTSVTGEAIGDDSSVGSTSWPTTQIPGIAPSESGSSVQALVGAAAGGVSSAPPSPIRVTGLVIVRLSM